MLKRLLFCLLLMLAGPAMGQSSIENSIVSQLRGQGYSNIEVNRTLLGRIRFVADRGNERREIVVNPATGVLMRDYTFRIPSGAPAPVVQDRERDRDSDRDRSGSSASSRPSGSDRATSPSGGGASRNSGNDRSGAGSGGARTSDPPPRNRTTRDDDDDDDDDDDE